MRTYHSAKNQQTHQTKLSGLQFIVFDSNQKQWIREKLVKLTEKI